MPARLGLDGAAAILLGAVLFSGCGYRETTSPPPARIAADGGEPVLQEQHVTAVSQGLDSAVRNDDPLHPMVAIETSMGKITVQLDAENAPRTVRNFLDYANSGHFDETIFHYVRPDEMIIGGGFTANLEEKSTTEPIRNEAHNGLKNTRGTIAMSRDFESIDSARCQFFINLVDNPALDHRQRSPEEYGYCVFGRVVAGLDVAERIAKTPAHDKGEFVSTPVAAVIIRSVQLLR
jgi:cyclophilin family peptidyl-prolyl cis-trans isomerase